MSLQLIGLASLLLSLASAPAHGASFGGCVNAGIRRMEAVASLETMAKERRLKISEIQQHETAEVQEFMDRRRADMGLILAKAAGTEEHDSTMTNVELNYRSPNGRFFVVRNEEGKVVGTCAWTNNSYRSSAGADTSVELQMMYTEDDPIRYRGLGFRLANLVVWDAKAMGYNEMNLETTSQMVRARELYESLGFVEDRSHECKPPVDCFYKLNLENWNGPKERTR